MMSALNANGRRRTSRRRGATTIELVTLFVVIGIVLSAAVGQFLPTQRDVLDKAGPTVVATSVLNVRAVASANHYRYPADAQATVAGLNELSAAHQSKGLAVAYTDGRAELKTDDAGKRTMTVSVAAGSPVTVGLAVITSSAGPQDASCLLAVDSLRTGTRYAQVKGADADSNECSGAAAVACEPHWDAAAGSGTAAEPYTLEPEAPCLRETA